MAAGRPMTRLALAVVTRERISRAVARRDYAEVGRLTAIAAAELEPLNTVESGAFLAWTNGRVGVLDLIGRASCAPGTH
jgi:hypothetical protein